jgi:hypothetical protein
MIAPRPGETRIHNLVATMLQHGNASHTLNLPRIAHHQGFDLADLTDAFARAETTLSLTPVTCVEDE